MRCKQVEEGRREILHMVHLMEVGGMEVSCVGGLAVGKGEKGWATPSRAWGDGAQRVRLTAVTPLLEGGRRGVIGAGVVSGGGRTGSTGGEVEEGRMAERREEATSGVTPGCPEM